MGFWDVGMLYGHPCKWQGTLFDPGPTVDDLAAALVDIPLRNASQPIDVTLDGYAGKYVEWTVPTDIETDEQGNAVDCDTDGGEHFFESWIGDQSGWGGDRYHQGPGQVDPLWILDVDGCPLRDRRVLDAFGNHGGARGAPGRCRIHPVRSLSRTRDSPTLRLIVPSPRERVRRQRTEP